MNDRIGKRIRAEDRKAKIEASRPKKNPFSTDVLDKIRAAFKAGKRTFVHEGRTYTLRLQKKRYILVKPANGSLIPMANIETTQTRERKKKSWREQALKNSA